MQTKTRNAEENRVDWKTEERDTKKETWKQSREARHGGRERVRDTEGEQNRLWRTYIHTRDGNETTTQGEPHKKGIKLISQGNSEAKTRIN